jgi:L-fucose isomerase
MGSVSMGIAGSIVDPGFFEDYLGMRCEAVDMTEFVRRIDEGIYDEKEFKRALKWTKANCKEGEDFNSARLRKSAKEKDKIWEFVVKMTMIGRDLMAGNPRLAELGFGEEALGHNALCAGFQGQRQWTDHLPNGDFMETILNSSFDWNGIRQPYVLATENDALNGVAMLFGQLLTGASQGFSDVRTYWSPEAVYKATGHKLNGDGRNGLIHLINSGATTMDATGQQAKNGKPAMKPFWEITPAEAGKCLDAIEWCAAIAEYFRGGGFSSRFMSKGGMPITMSRINLIKGLGPVLQIAEGATFELPARIHDKLDRRTNPSWPTTWFAPRITGKGAFADVYSVMANWGANHGAFSYGHIGADLIALASMLRIPVCMHNVPESDIYRPSAWAAFGMDAEGSDYRACQAFGPVYR